MLALCKIIMFHAQKLVVKFTHGCDSTTHCSTNDVYFFKTQSLNTTVISVGYSKVKTLSLIMSITQSFLVIISYCWRNDSHL